MVTLHMKDHDKKVVGKVMSCICFKMVIEDVVKWDAGNLKLSLPPQNDAIIRTVQVFVTDIHLFWPYLRSKPHCALKSLTL